jgi:predicted metal-dependent peptidase
MSQDVGFLIEKAVTKLVMKEPFFAAMIQGMTRQATTKVATAGVNVTDTVNLYVNPYWWQSLTLDEQVDILKHECYHVINNHFSRFKDLEPGFWDKDRSVIDRINDQFNASTLNQAADYPINQLLPNIPKTFKMFDDQGNPVLEPDVIPDPKDHTKTIPNPNAGKPVVARPLLIDDLKKKYPQVKEKETMEYYYRFIKENFPKQKISVQMVGSGGKGQDQQQQGQNGQQPQQGMGAGDNAIIIDDHSIWNEGDQDAEVVGEKVKDLVNEAAERVGGLAAGKIPSDVAKLIDALNHVPRNWKQDLQRFVARSCEMLIESSRKKRNRRYGLLYPGYKTFPKLHLAVAVDTSGSVYVADVMNQFGAEMLKIHNMDVELTIIECDASIHAVYKFDPKREIKFHGGGGTAFGPVFKELEKNHDVDGLIYLTDGENYDRDGLKKPNYPVLWALLPGCRKPVEWGSETVVEIKKRMAL